MPTNAINADEKMHRLALLFTSAVVNVKRAFMSLPAIQKNPRPTAIGRLQALNNPLFNFYKADWPELKQTKYFPSTIPAPKLQSGLLHSISTI